MGGLQEEALALRNSSVALSVPQSKGAFFTRACGHCVHCLQEEALASRESSVALTREGSVLGAPTMKFKQPSPQALQAIRIAQERDEQERAAHEARAANARAHLAVGGTQSGMSVSRGMAIVTLHTWRWGILCLFQRQTQ